MVLLILGTAVGAGVGIGWYGHKAGVRIAAWGLRANEQDLIFQQMCGDDGGGEVWPAEKRRIEDATIGVASVTSHYPAAATALK